MKVAQKKQGFTLIEIVISITIISIMLLIAVDVIRSSNKILNKGEKYLELTEEILLVKKQFNFDFESLQRTSYLPFEIIKQEGNDMFVFAIAKEGLYKEELSPRPLSVVAYAINDDDTQKAQGFMRAQRGIAFGASNSNSSPKGYPLPGINNNKWVDDHPFEFYEWELVSPRVLRLEISILLNDGKILNSEELKPEDYPKIALLMFSCVVVDNKLLKLNRSTLIDDLITYFPDSVDDTFPIKNWQEAKQELPDDIKYHIKVFNKALLISKDAQTVMDTLDL